MEENNNQPKYIKTIPDPEDVKILNIIGNHPCYEDRVILDRKKLIWTVGVFKKEGLSVGYTGGVYDQLHDGHVLYLAKAKSLCDILVVGIDDDKLTRQRKPNDKNRPIDPLAVRLLNVVHNRSVNIVTVRTVHEPLSQLVKDILPEIAVYSKGTKDAEEQEIREDRGAYCGELVFLDPMSSNSTTAKIRKVMINGAHELALHLKKDLIGNVDLKLLEASIDKYYTNLKEGGST